MKTKEKNLHAVFLGKLGGARTSLKKKKSSRENGKLGGRPKGSKNKVKINIDEP